MAANLLLYTGVETFRYCGEKINRSLKRCDLLAISVPLAGQRIGRQDSQVMSDVTVVDHRNHEHKEITWNWVVLNGFSEAPVKMAY